MSLIDPQRSLFSPVRAVPYREGSSHSLRDSCSAEVCHKRSLRLLPQREHQHTRVLPSVVRVGADYGISATCRVLSPSRTRACKRSLNRLSSPYSAILAWELGVVPDSDGIP